RRKQPLVGSGKDLRHCYGFFSSAKSNGLMFTGTRKVWWQELHEFDSKTRPVRLRVAFLLATARASSAALERNSIASFIQSSWPVLLGGRNISRLPDSAINNAWPRANVHESLSISSLLRVFS